MTNLEIRERIATKVMGWKKTTFPNGMSAQKHWPCYTIESGGEMILWRKAHEDGEAFEPESDIAAAYDMEWMIPAEKRGLYAYRLSKILQAAKDDSLKIGTDMYWLLAHATPMQRCLAALEAVNGDKP